MKRAECGCPMDWETYPYGDREVGEWVVDCTCPEPEKEEEEEDDEDEDYEALPVIVTKHTYQTAPELLNGMLKGFNEIFGERR